MKLNKMYFPRPKPTSFHLKLFSKDAENCKLNFMNLFYIVVVLSLSHI